MARIAVEQLERGVHIPKCQRVGLRKGELSFACSPSALKLPGIAALKLPLTGQGRTLLALQDELAKLHAKVDDLESKAKRFAELAALMGAERTQEEYLRCCAGFVRYHMKLPRELRETADWYARRWGFTS